MEILHFFVTNDFDRENNLLEDIRRYKHLFISLTVSYFVNCFYLIQDFLAQFFFFFFIIVLYNVNLCFVFL